jgi:hypothetical protein
MRPFAALLALCACSGGGGGGSSSSLPPPPPAVVADSAVTGPSPFAAACGGSGGVLYINAEVEPHIAINPRDANNLVGVWQQDRWSSGSSRGNLTGVSLDGGTTWSSAQAAFSQCAGGEFARATDPWVTFSPDGTAYQVALGSTGGTFAAGSTNAVMVSRSADGGRSWSAPLALIRDGGQFFNDKESISADPNDARFVYAVWDRLRDGGNGPTYFARTLDGGATWEPARSIYDPGTDAQTIGNLIRVLPDGTLVNLATRLQGVETAPTDARLEVIRSADRGATWSAPIRVASYLPLGARDPATAQRIRDGTPIAEMAVAPNGTLYVAWQDGRFTGVRDAIALSRSTDGGLTWSAPARINADPGVAAFNPQVHVRADGTVGVAYYDFRPDTADAATLLTDYWLARSVDGINWTEARVAGPFNLNTAPLADGAFFLGDYMGLASSGATFLAFYARTTGSLDNRTDIFLTRIPAETMGAASTQMQSQQRVVDDAVFRARVAENLAQSLAARRVR